MAQRYFLGEGRPAQRADARREGMRRVAQHVGDDFAHPQEGVVLDALGGADEQSISSVKVRQHRLKDSPSVMRRHDADDDVGAAQSLVEVVGRDDRLRESDNRREIVR